MNGKECTRGSEKTIIHYIKQPWSLQGKNQSYCFRDDPECDVVYFSQDESVIKRSEVRRHVGIKDKSGDFLVCYCFGMTSDDANDHPEAKAFLIIKTKQHIYECEIRNPSAKCCLKNLPNH